MYGLMEQERTALVTCHTRLGVKGLREREQEDGTCPRPSPTGVEPLRHMEAALEGETNALCLWSQEGYGLRFHGPGIVFSLRIC